MAQKQFGMTPACISNPHPKCPKLTLRIILKQHPQELKNRVCSAGVRFSVREVSISLLRLLKRVRKNFSDDRFLTAIHEVEKLVARVLSIMLILVVLVAVKDLSVVLFNSIISPEVDLSGKRLLELAGLFLNILIALELLANITAYLSKLVAQVELVVITALIAVARKIIILDLEKTAGLDLAALALAIFAISISYWIVHQSTSRSDPDH
jgi:uncharacterized membrane protein (DUF373 family)